MRVLLSLLLSAHAAFLLAEESAAPPAVERPPAGLGSVHPPALGQLEESLSRTQSAPSGGAEAAKRKAAQGFDELTGRAGPEGAVYASRSARAQGSSLEPASAAPPLAAKADVPGVFAAKEVHAAKAKASGAMSNPNVMAALGGLIGAAIGFAVGGPIGAVVGFLIGALIGAAASHH